MSKKIYQAIVPSNIALLKYWGKSDETHQWPANDSLSISLSGLHTKTKAWLHAGDEHQVELAGQQLSRDSRQGSKIFKHLDFLKETLGANSNLTVQTENSFPTGCGIASSASGLAALTLAAVAAWRQCSSLEELAKQDIGLDQLCHWSRLGSGSACRSLMGGIVQWQRGDQVKDQSVHQLFDHQHWPLRDTVVLFSQAEKAVGSTEAHRAAWTSPLFAPRLAGLGERLAAMKQAIEHRDMRALGPLIEQETLEMHAVIMSAEPPVRYFDKETGAFLAWLREQRRQLDLPVYFTLDAGPNVHLIYENHHHEAVIDLLRKKFSPDAILEDEMGSGPQLVELHEGMGGER